VTVSEFGRLPTGDPVRCFHLHGPTGLDARLLDYGGLVISLRTPDRTGTPGEVVLGFDDLEAYLTRSPFFGAIVGRYANRIAGGRFTLDGRTCTLAVNNGPNHLHGGLRGWDKHFWTAEPFTEGDAPGLRLHYVSADGEEGYPGRVDVSVTYRLTDDHALRVDCEATTDAPTVINVTQHSYFNLSAAPDVLGHEVTLFADRYVPVDPTLVPLGTLAPVDGTPFDFRAPTPIGLRIDAPDDQLRYGKGYDHTFVVNRTGPGLAEAALVVAPDTGRTLAMATTQPGFQFYTGNALSTMPGRSGETYGRHAGFCLESQHFPDSPNQPAFPSPVLRPGERYAWTTVYRFGLAE